MIMNSLLNWLLGKSITVVKAEELYSSKYISLYEHRRSKRDYRQHLERTTLNRLNDYLINEFPKNLKNEDKKEIIDCTVVFLKYITINYDYFPGGEIFEKEFNKVIARNIEKFRNK